MGKAYPKAIADICEVESPLVMRLTRSSKWRLIPSKTEKAHYTIVSAAGSVRTEIRVLSMRLDSAIGKMAGYPRHGSDQDGDIGHARGSKNSAVARYFRFKPGCLGEIIREFHRRPAIGLGHLAD